MAYLSTYLIIGIMCAMILDLDYIEAHIVKNYTSESRWMYTFIMMTLDVVTDLLLWPVRLPGWILHIKRNNWDF